MDSEKLVTPEYIETLRKSLIYAMSSDNQIEESERVKIFDVFLEMTGTSLGHEEYEKEMEDFTNWSKDFLDIIGDLSKGLNYNQKEGILKANIYVIIADGKIDDAEKHYFSHLASALDFPSDTLKDMISELLLGSSLECPKCYGKLRIYRSKENAKLCKCIKCSGVWLNKSELEAIVKNKEDLEKFNKVGLMYCEGSKLRCPKCKQTCMEVGRFPGTNIVIDKCMKCHGLYFDQGELKNLLNHS